jgi:hypothetical protein
VNIVAGGLDQDIIAKFNFRALAGYKYNFTGGTSASPNAWTTVTQTQDMLAENGSPADDQPFCILIQKVKRLT